jgi:hypothetical protein
MNLEQYKKWYAIDDGHLYTSKVKQINRQSINEMARALSLFNNLFTSFKTKNTLYEKFKKFGYNSGEKNYLLKNSVVPKSKVSSLFLALEICVNDLWDLEHLRTVNLEKHSIVQDLIKDYLEEKTYKYFIKKYDKNFLASDIRIHVRNYYSWLQKFGFCGFDNNIFYTTEAGIEYLNNSDDDELTEAIFTQQIKKYRIWNPTMQDKYKKIDIMPYYLILQVLLKIPNNSFTKDEYVLFITKIKSHKISDIDKCIDYIVTFRKFSEENKRNYKREIQLADKSSFPDRKRTHLETLEDSAGKEIPLYCFSNLTSIKSGQHGKTIVLNNKLEAEKELKKLKKNLDYNITDKYDWIRYHGSFGELTIDDVVENYLINFGQDRLLEELQKTGVKKKDAEKIVSDHILEKDIEKFYLKNLHKISPNLKVVKSPHFGNQFPTTIGIIDLLCFDIKAKKYVVIEFKRGSSSDEVVGQTMRYMGWVYLNLEKENNSVKGVIVSRNLTNKLEHALIGLQSELITHIQHHFDDDNRPNLQE